MSVYQKYGLNTSNETLNQGAESYMQLYGKNIIGLLFHVQNFKIFTALKCISSEYSDRLGLID